MVQVKNIELIVHFEDGRVFNMDTGNMSACEETLKSLSEEEQQIIESYLGAFE
jgi:hypothetical protein